MSETEKYIAIGSLAGTCTVWASYLVVEALGITPNLTILAITQSAYWGLRLWWHYQTNKEKRKNDEKP